MASALRRCLQLVAAPADVVQLFARRATFAPPRAAHPAREDGVYASVPADSASRRRRTRPLRTRRRAH